AERVDHGGAVEQTHRVRTVLQIDAGDEIGVGDVGHAAAAVGDDEHAVGRNGAAERDAAVDAAVAAVDAFQRPAVQRGAGGAVELDEDVAGVAGRAIVQHLR